MKIIELRKAPKNKIGRINLNGVELELHESKTVLYLSQFGYDIELVRPSNIPKSKNPDIEMLGTFWEMKGPQTFNELTIKARFRKARKQADGRAIFDLRSVKINSDKVEKYILELFSSSREMKRLIIIRLDGTAIDVRKK